MKRLSRSVFTDLVHSGIDPGCLESSGLLSALAAHRDQLLEKDLLRALLADFARNSRERLAQEARLRALSETLDAILSSIDDLVFVIDLAGRILEARIPESRRGALPPVADFTGLLYEKTPLPGPLVEFLGRQTQLLWDKPQAATCDFEWASAGGPLWFSAVLSPLKSLVGRRTGSVVVCRDITERKAHERDLEVLGTTDTLTGIFNRRKFLSRLQEELRLSRRYDRVLCLVMFDLDHFKKVNDDWGHDVGDYVLLKTATVVRNAIRDTDVFARWGGEEFILLLPQSDLDTAFGLAERLRSSIENTDYEKAKTITASFGAAEFVRGESEYDFLKRVDTALFASKNNGRNRVSVSKAASKAAAGATSATPKEIL